LSKLGVLSRSESTIAIREGRVSVDGTIVRDIAHPVVPERARIRVDGTRVARASWRTVLLNKPRGVVTTRRDPQGRPTVFDDLGEDARSLVAVGRLDLATTGLLLLTSDTRLADWITDPLNGVPRVYVVTVRGRVTPGAVAMLLAGVRSRSELLRAQRVTIDKASGRESRLIVELHEGRNREIRRMCETAGHEVTRLKRVQLGGLTLGSLPPGCWRDVTRAELRAAFPGAPMASRPAEV
ncbi:MAG: pseudouridine synthase, partial [Vicinamibacterales bacterium]